MDTRVALNPKSSQGNDRFYYFRVYAWTVSFMKPYVGPLALFILCGLVVSAAELVIPKFVQYFIDVLLPQKQSRLFGYLLACIALFMMIKFIASAVQNLLERTIREKAARDMQFSIFKHLRTLGFSYFENHAVGETLSLLNTEVNAVLNIYRRYLPEIMKLLILLTISLAFMLSLDYRLTLIMIPCFGLYYTMGPYFEKKASHIGKVNADNRIKLNRKIYESISAMRELRAFGAQKQDLEAVMDSIATFGKSRLKLVMYTFYRGTFRSFSYNSGAIAVFIYGAYLIRTDSLTVGKFVAYLFYYFFAMQIVTYIVTLITEQRVLMFQAERLYQFQKLIPDVSEPAQPIILNTVKGELELRNVCFGYPNRPLILNGLDLHIRPGERIALVGSSGNGKSTVLKLLNRFYDTVEGDILLDGVPIRSLSFAQLRESLGYVFQETYLYGSTVRDNIEFGHPGATEEQIIDAAKAAYAHDFIMQLPNGYDTVVGERGVKLSGGQRQRISIARMFIKNPAIVLLDEATSALDNISEQEVQQALDQLLKGRTTITIAHRLSTVRHYDKIAVIDQGKIVEMGNYDELLVMRGVFYQLVNGRGEAHPA